MQRVESGTFWVKPDTSWVETGTLWVESGTNHISEKWIRIRRLNWTGQIFQIRCEALTELNLRDFLGWIRGFLDWIRDFLGWIRDLSGWIRDATGWIRDNFYIFRFQIRKLHQLISRTKLNGSEKEVRSTGQTEPRRLSKATTRT